MADREQATEEFNTKRLFIYSKMILADASDIQAGTGTGTKLGTATGQKLGFWNVTPVVQPSAIADPASDTASNNAAIDSILAALRTMGLIAT